MIYVGIDDTDVLDAPGTNQLARFLARELADEYRCRLIVRHKLLDHPQVPCTSKNSAAALLFEPRGDGSLTPLIDRLKALMASRFVEGSDPGLCVTEQVPEDVAAFGRRCQRELVDQSEARQLAAHHGLYLEGLGGTQDGVIGALAAVGLASTGNDGRVVQIGDWPDDLAGPQEPAVLASRGVEVRCIETGATVAAKCVDVGKHLRPNYRQGRIVLMAARDGLAQGPTDCWQAVRLP